MTLDLARDSTAPARLPVPAIEMDLIAENLLGGERQWATRDRFVLVALGHKGHPTPIPSLPSGADAVN